MPVPGGGFSLFSCPAMGRDSARGGEQLARPIKSRFFMAVPDALAQHPWSVYYHYNLIQLLQLIQKILLRIRRISPCLHAVINRTTLILRTRSGMSQKRLAPSIRLHDRLKYVRGHSVHPLVALAAFWSVVKDDPVTDPLRQHVLIAKAIHKIAYIEP